MSKSILVVNDVPGIGKVAGNINLPVLSAFGIETSILPTVILSSQTGHHYPEVISQSMGETFAQILTLWDKNKVIFDTYLTGYFVDSNQIDAFQNYYQKVIQESMEVSLIIDPILGDQGHLYQSLNLAMIESYQKLMPYADIVLPNLTEASLMSGIAYQPIYSKETLQIIGSKILDLGVKHLIITGVKLEDQEDKIGFLLFDEYHLQGEFYGHKYFQPDFFGTGDLVASIISGLYTCGYTLSEALTLAGPMVEKVIESTLAAERDPKRGLRFEGILNQVTNLGLGEEN